MIARAMRPLAGALALSALLTACDMPLEPEGEVTTSPPASESVAEAPSDATPAEGELTVTLTDPAWNGDRVPVGQQCTKFGGIAPKTPPLRVAGLPIGTLRVLVEFNDADYQPLSYDGGHGKIAFEAGPGTALLPPVLGETTVVPPGVAIAARNRATGDFARPGYLPPCSGGNDHSYFAVVKAIGPAQEVLAEGRITIGRY